jgi:hypothetical protein
MKRALEAVGAASRQRQATSTSGDSKAGARRSEPRLNSSITRRDIGTGVVVAVLAIIYVIFVLHYAVNVVFFDEWDVVPIIHAALHSHLTLGVLWTQHNENRMLVPNLLFVASALVHNYNSKAVMLFSALLFIVSYVLILAVFRRYIGRHVSPVHALTLGVVWFSFEDTGNALLAFQLAWYLIVLCLMVLIFLFSKERRHHKVVLALAVVTSVAASFSSIQGLIVWPIGLILLLWKLPRTRQRCLEASTWCVLAVITAGIYFYGWNSNWDGGSLGFAIHHPIGMVKFFLASVGNVVPTTNTDLRTHELLGVALCAVSLYVIVLSIRDRAMRVRIPLPVSLIAFGLLFDGSVALGRLNYGIAYALSSRYTMANLVVLVGIVAFAWAHEKPAQVTRERDHRLGTIPRFAFLALMMLFLVVQVSTATNIGIKSAGSIRESRVIAAQTLVNLDRMPSSESQQLLLANDLANDIGSYSLLGPLLREAQEDHLSVFAPGPYAFYRSKGPPVP